MLTNAKHMCIFLNMKTERVRRSQRIMDQQIMKGVRLPLPIIEEIEQTVQEDHSTFSQFMRTAAVNELKRRKRLLREVNA